MDFCIFVARPPHVQYSSDGTSIKMMNVQRDNSAMVSCTAFNKAGIKFKAAQLNVYGKFCSIFILIDL